MLVMNSVITSSKLNENMFLLVVYYKPITGGNAMDGVKPTCKITLEDKSLIFLFRYPDL